MNKNIILHNGEIYKVKNQFSGLKINNLRWPQNLNWLTDDTVLVKQDNLILYVGTKDTHNIFLYDNMFITPWLTTRDLIKFITHVKT